MALGNIVMSIIFVGNSKAPITIFSVPQYHVI